MIHYSNVLKKIFFYSSVEVSTETAEVEKPVNEESLIAAVNESAEEGIAWFSSFLGFNFGNTNTSSSAQ